MKFRFMGQEFENQEQLVKAFPAFGGADALRAIRAGASTPMEVEIASWRVGSLRQNPLTPKSGRAKAAIARNAAKRSKAA